MGLKPAEMRWGWKENPRGETGFLDPASLKSCPSSLSTVHWRHGPYIASRQMGLSASNEVINYKYI